MDIMKNIYLTTVLIISLALSLTANATGSKFASHEKIRTAARQFLVEKANKLGFQDFTVEVGHLDNRLRLPTCNSELTAKGGNHKLPGNISIAVRCNSDKPWKIYIQASVKAYKSIYVARAPIARGEIVRKSNLKMAKQDVTSLNGNYFTDINLINGHIAKRLIRENQAIKSYMLTKSKVIRRGEYVTIIAETSGISIKMKGKALNDATIGEHVRVKNMNSKRIIEGTAIRTGVVKINI